MQRCVSQFLLAASLCVAATTAFAQPEPPPPGPPAYDPSRPLPTILPPDPPYADPDPEADPEPGNPPSDPGYAEPTAQQGIENAPAPAANPSPTYAAAPPAAEYETASAAAPTRRLRFPDFTIQAEVLNVLPYGRLGFEFEFKLLDWLTVGTTPLFVVAREPLFIPPHIRQASNGIGPLAGASLSVGFWLGERTFEGTVLRLAFTNYGYRYEGVSREDYEDRDVSRGQILDRASHTERRLRITAGHSFRFGHFMLSGAAGIEYELNQERRCLVPLGDGGAPYVPTSDRCAANTFGIQRRVSRPDAFNVYGLGGPLYPFALVLNLSLGVIVTP